MNSIGISIIVPSFNGGHFLTETIESILGQSIKNRFEIIIVDDGSTDPSTLSILEKFRNVSNIKIKRLNENHGVQHARNVGIKLAVYDFIMTIDGDDQLCMDKLVLEGGTFPDRAIQILISNSNVAFVHALWNMFGDFNGLTISSYPISEDLVIKKHHVQTNIVYRKEDALGAGAYDEDIKKWQDWSFAVGLLNYRFVSKKKREIVYIDKPFYLYRIHNKINRISKQNIDEREMVRKTFLRHPAIFRNYYHLSDEEIVNKVLKNKPSRKKEFLFVIRNNLNLGIKIFSQRVLYYLSYNKINIP
jgi:glycosyltransferase involved in cell wall biosynthesis